MNSIIASSCSLTYGTVVEIIFGQNSFLLPVTVTYPSFQVVVAAIREAFTVDAQVVYYDDDEGERVTVKTDEELNEAYGLSQSPVLFVDKHDKPLPKSNLRIEEFPIFQLQSTVPPPGESTIAFSDQLLLSIQNELGQISTKLSEFSRTRNDDTLKIQRENQYNQGIQKLQQLCEDVTKENDQLQQNIQNYFKENELLKEKSEEKREELAHLSQDNEKLLSTLQRDLLEIGTAKEASTRLGTQLQTKIKHFFELKSKSEKNGHLEERIDRLRKELDTKTDENLHMSKEILEIRAESSAAVKKYKTLEQQLKVEQQELKTLQNSFMELQSSMRFDVNNQQQPQPPLDRTTVSYMQLPEDISPVDMEYLFAMGYRDKDHNIALLREHKNVDSVTEILIKNQPK